MSPIFTWLIIGLMAFLPLASIAAPDEDLLAEGNKKMVAQNYAGAEADYQSVVSQYPLGKAGKFASYRMIETAYRTGQFSNAVARATAFIASHDQEPGDSIDLCMGASLWKILLLVRGKVITPEVGLQQAGAAITQFASADDNWKLRLYEVLALEQIAAGKKVEGCSTLRTAVLQYDKTADPIIVARCVLAVDSTVMTPAEYLQFLQQVVADVPDTEANTNLRKMLHAKIILAQ